MPAPTLKDDQMSKFIAPLFAASLLFSPAALAKDFEEISVELEYDNSILENDEGAKSVLKSLKKQAKSACQYQVAYNSIEAVDRACVKSVVAKAAAEILAERSAAGLETAPVFARAASVQIAQR